MVTEGRHHVTTTNAAFTLGRRCGRAGMVVANPQPKNDAEREIIHAFRAGYTAGLKNPDADADTLDMDGAE